MGKGSTGKNRKVNGFTLIEVVVVLAIITILMMVAIPGVAQIQDLLKSTEMEAGARQLYIAAQNRLTLMKSAGTLRNINPLYEASLIDEGSLEWITTDHMPADYDNSESTWSNEELCFAINKNIDGSPAPGKLITDILVPAGAVDPSVLKGYYVIEYNPSNGSIYGVFFSEEAFLYSEVRDTDRTSTQLRNIEGQPVIGYYGGILLLTPDIEEADLSDSAFFIENEEKLLIRISPIVTKEYTLLIEDKDNPTGFSSYTYTFNGNQSEFGSYPNISKEVATNDIVILLDSLQTNRHFEDFFGASIEKPAITPGRDIRITLSVEDFNATATTMPSQSSKAVNSLFAGRFGDEAFLSSARHLQNLEPTISGVLEITGATVQKAIDWDLSEATLFKPISNSELKSFSGGGNPISNLSITTNGEYSGLFGEFGGSTENAASISDIKLTDATISGGSADYVGTLAGYIHHTTISNSSTFVLYPSIATNGSLLANAARGAGGFAGTSNNNSYTNCFASLKDLTVNLTGDSGTSGVGGFIGISTSDSIEHCYANTTEILVSTSGSYAYSGGFAGRSNSTISYSYAVGNINQNEGTASAGFSYAFGGSASNCYAATTFNETEGLSGYTYGFSNRASTNCSYYSGADPTYTSVIGGITSRDISGLQTVYSGTNWRVPTTASTKPYNLELTGQAYPISLVPTLLHYGDWPVTEESGQSVDMAYYEIYHNTKSSIYSIGFYNEELDLDSLSESTSDLKIIQDGYIVLFETDGGSGTAQGISYTNLTSESYVKLTWRMNGTTRNTTNKNLMKEAKDIRYNGSSLQNSIYYNGATINSTSILSLSSGNYYYRFLSNNHIVVADYATSSFFQSLKIDLYPNTTTMSSSYTYYYNPHFAKSKIAYETSPGQSNAGTLYLRTTRQYATLSLSEMYQYWTRSYSFSLESDMDFANNSYTSTYFDQNITRHTNPQPIGTTAHRFQGIFQGNNHQVNQVNIVTAQNTQDYGVFGRTRDSSIENLKISNITINQAMTRGINHIGSLIGNAYRTNISNVTIAGSSLRGQYMVGGAIGKFDGGNVSNLTIEGSTSINASRLAGGVFGQITNSTAVNISNINLSGLNMQVPSWTAEPGGMTGSMMDVSAAYGTGGLVGCIAPITNKNNDVSLNGISISSSSITQNNLTDATEAKYYATAFLVGNYHSTSAGIRMDISNVNIESTTLYAYASGGDNAGAAYGGYFGKVFAAGTLSIEDTCVIKSSCQVNRSSASANQTTGLGGYFGWVLGYGSSYPITINLTSASPEHQYGVNFNWGAWNYLPNTTAGGIAGVIGTDVRFGSASINGVYVTSYGGDTGGLAGSISSSIKNISLNNVTILNQLAKENTNTGGFAGVISNAEIANCDVRMSDLFNSSLDPMTIGDTSTWDANLVNYVRAAGNIGGFAGKIEGAQSDITYCFAAIGVTTITNDTYDHALGGFVGVLDSGSISNCYTSGNVRQHKGDSKKEESTVIGGFVGEIINTNSASPLPVIENCYSSGIVRHNLSYSAGGFVGLQEEGIIISCYTASPNIAIDKAEFRRGFIGYLINESPGTFTNSLYYASQPEQSSPGNGSWRKFSTPEINRVKEVNALSNLHSSIFGSGYFGNFEEETAATPYTSSLGSNYPYPGLSGVGRSVSGPMHFGNWVKP
ncbi:MAG: type II secretion system protein [Clostridia bacterium]|nr:type II secretion system protein [Clostridia bacterium]